LILNIQRVQRNIFFEHKAMKKNICQRNF